MNTTKLSTDANYKESASSAVDVGFPLTSTSGTLSATTTNASNCITLGSPFGYYQQTTFNYMTINKAANGFSILLNNQTYVFQTVKQLVKFIESNLSLKDKK